MLRYGIPPYRLPRSVVDWEIEGILRLGVAVLTGTALGRDFTLDSLTGNGFEAVFLGLGAWTVPPLGIPGEAADNVLASLDFLSAAGTRIDSLAGRSVVIVGESNTAMDCSRIGIRLRADRVTVICPTGRKEMTARKRDVERAEEEGARILFGTRPVRIVTGPAGQAISMECVDLLPVEGQKAPAESDERPSHGRFLLSADLVVIACERTPDLEVLSQAGGTGGFCFTKKSSLAAEKTTLLASPPGIFTGGDMHTGRATVIGAVAEARRAARAIHQLLTYGKITVPKNLHRKVNPKSILKRVSVSRKIPKVRVRELPVERRIRSFIEEIEGTLSDEQARAEAARCLRCGTTCYDRCSPNPAQFFFQE
jgi:NADPH-dependent glutamate synthase beta subunit-like oxidoreductase